MDNVQDKITGEPLIPARPGGGMRRGLVAGIAAIFVVILSAGWMVFPYFLDGHRILQGVGSSLETEQRGTAATVSRLLTRVAEYPGQTGHEVQTDILFATPTYFSVSSRNGAVADYRPDTHHVFIVNETSHTAYLPDKLPEARLIVDGKAYAPESAEGPLNAQHHRSTVIRFAKRDTAGDPVITEDAQQITVEITANWNDKPSTRSASWALPIAYPEDLSGTTLFPPIAVMALSAGLLSSVLTPCLIQLIVIYLAALTGLSASEVSRNPGHVPQEARRRLLMVSLAFVAGFIVLYTAAGALIGFVGQSAQMLFADWSRTMSISAGVLMIALGIWVGARAKAPIVCNLPIAPAIARFGQSTWGAALMSAGFSLGCITCFGGAIIATMLIYVGALGSASVGALVMFLFSLGVAIPFLAAALLLSRVMPLMGWIEEHTRVLGLISMLIIVAFGLVLITNNFHVVSNMIYPLLRLQ